MLEWEWYKDSKVKDLFIHCLLKANHRDKKWQGILIKKGSFLTSISKLSQELSFSPMQIRTAIKKLKSTNEITIETTSQYTIIQVVKHEQYQSNNKPANKPITNGEQTDNKPITTTKNDKNKENVKKIVAYLNSKTKKTFKDSSQKTKECIIARFNEGFVLEDFKKVIDTKCSHWLDDNKMNEYLRPETLFSNKFESYLNAEPTKGDPRDVVYKQA